MLFSFASVLLASTAFFESIEAAEFGRYGNLHRQRQARADASVADYAAFSKKDARATKMRYLNKNTKPYQVTSMPDVNYDLGELYSGMVPITKGDKSRELFYVFKPKIGGDPVDEVTIWLNGGPGCSSLDGFFQENGPIVWQPGTYAPTPNPYSWANLTNMLYVEQPVGTGYSTGKPVATTQEETAADFVKFFKNWQQIFGIKNYKIYVTGESYAGRYVPYISAAILDQKDKTYYNLQGALMYDPCIGQFDFTQEEVFTWPFIQANQNLFQFNETFKAELAQIHQSCGYQDLIDKYLTFPPPGHQPAEFFNFSDPTALKCDIFDVVNTEAFSSNPCFNIYEVNAMCPLLSDVLAFPTELVDPDGGQMGGSYFNRTDVKKAMHAPLDSNWAVCSLEPVYVGGSSGPQSEGDTSADPIQKVLPQVIEATNRVLVGNGDFDMVIITNGTLMAIQNMTWNNQLGFQSQPKTPINIQLPDLQYKALFTQNGVPSWDGAQGIMGIQHYERGLMWVETFQSGHMQPEFQPRVAYRHLEWLLGHVETI